MLKRIFHKLVVPASVGFMVWLVVDQWNQLAAFQWQLNPWFFLVAFLGIIILFLLDAFGWHLILKAMGEDLRPHQSIYIWMISSITRYLPGGLWPYISRASLAKDEGMNIMASGISLYLESLLLITSSLAVGLPALLGTAEIEIRPLTALIILTGFGLLMHPKIIRLLRFIPGPIKKALQSTRLPRVPVILGLYLYYTLFWILFGLVFVCFVYSVFPGPVENIIHTGSAIALAFFAGFILVFFPGGIGIRETALYLMLIPSLPHSVCLVISIGSRLWVMLGEGMSICLVLGWRKTTQKKTAPIQRTADP